VTSREQVARALAFFEACDDPSLLHRVLEEAAPRAKRMVASYLAKGAEDSIPGPADLRGARESAGQDEALKTLQGLNDFPLFQVLTRAIGQRIEAIEIAASADFPEGVRVVVPEKPSYPRAGRELPGMVEETGTHIRVLLDNGDTWSGPPSLARLGGGS
jgi:hypothetical protein